jgi:methyltransferase (TIGR00027 family)
VAAQRSRLGSERPHTPTGDTDAERRLYDGLRSPLALRVLAPTGMGARTAFFDTQVMTALSAGVNQVVIVGAGYDGRAFRFAKPGVRWFEVDHPATQPDKERRARATGAEVGSITYLPVDLLVGDVGEELRRRGHDRTQPSLFYCEGLFSYLPNTVGESLCERLGAAAAPRSRLAASFLVRRTGHSSGVQRVVDRVLVMVGEPRLAHYTPGDAEAMFARTGWLPVETSRTPTSRISGSHLMLLAAARA